MTYGINMLHDWLTRYPGWLFLALLLVGGFALAMAFSAICECADPRHRAKLEVVLRSVFRAIAFLPLMGRHWAAWAVLIAALFVADSGRSYLRGYAGQLGLLWSLGVIALALAFLFADITVEGTQHGGSIVLGIVACAITALFSGFCFGFFAARSRAGRAVLRAEVHEC